MGPRYVRPGCSSLRSTESSAYRSTSTRLAIEDREAAPGQSSNRTDATGAGSLLRHGRPLMLALQPRAQSPGARQRFLSSNADRSQAEGRARPAILRSGRCCSFRLRIGTLDCDHGCVRLPQSRELRSAVWPSFAACCSLAAWRQYSSSRSLRTRCSMKLYNFYSESVLPRIGGADLRRGEAYTYLPESVSKFPDAPGWPHDAADRITRQVRFERMTFGIVALHTAI